MTRLELRTREVGPWPMNTYALVCPETNDSVLIDPGAEPDALQAMLGDSRPVAILLTHTHPDHVGALSEMKERLGVPVMAYHGEQVVPVEADRWLNDGDEVAVGRFDLCARYAPGHVDDHICFLIEKDPRIIVGDVIFEGGPGKTWSAEGFQTTLQTLQKVVLPWPDSTLCFPGHGPSFRLGNIRPAIEAFVAKDHGDFFGDATWDM